MVILENIDIDVVILENIDIVIDTDMVILENLNIDKILYQKRILHIEHPYSDITLHLEGHFVWTIFCLCQAEQVF